MKKSFTTFFALLLLSATTAFATSYTITVSGLAYSPDSLNVNVGDVITWNCSFTNHPLESTSVPAGATAFSANTGTIYTYTITTAGTYRYQCAFHNFTGVIIASDPSSIIESAINNPQFEIYPNPASSAVNIVVGEELIGSTVTLTDITGREVNSVLLSTANLPTGQAGRELSTASFANGIYFVTIRKDGAVLSQKLVVQR